MKLHAKYFEKIKNNEKTFEIRLNDEKRNLLCLNDLIKFSNRENNEELIVKIINLVKKE